MQNRWKLGHRPALDGLRGTAVLLVMASHIGLTGFGSGGWPGVTLFFVLSGFLISTLLLEERAATGGVRLRAFYFRRACRLFPALAAFVVIVGGAQILSGAPKIGTVLVGIVLYYSNWDFVRGIAVAPMAHVWSLAIEEQFYIVWPGLLLAGLAITKGRLKMILIGLAIGIIASTVLRLVLFDISGYSRAYYGTDTRADALLLGCALAVVFHSGRILSPSRLFAIVAALVIFVISWPPYLPQYNGPEMLGLTAGALASVVLVALAATKGSRILELRPLVLTGRISYGLYLWHVPILGVSSVAFADVFGHDPSFRWHVVVFFVMSFAAAIVSWYVVESPIQRWGRRRLASASLRAEPIIEAAAAGS